MNDGTNHPVFPNPLGTETNEASTEPIPQSLLDEKQFQNILITKEGEPDCIPLSTSNQYQPQMQEANVVFPDGLWGINHRRPN